MQSCLKILFIDDHAGLRDGTGYLLSQKNPSFQFFYAGDIDEAKLQMRVNPDITTAIVDLNLDGQSGLDAVALLRKRNPDLKVLIFTMFNDPLHIQQSLKSNIQGYITKNATIDELEKAIIAVSEGNLYYNKQTTQIMQSIIQADEPADEDLSESVQLFQRYRTLTKKEQEVFSYLAQKKDTAEIAEILGKSEKTVINQKSMIYQKLNVRDRLDIIEFAKVLGIIV